MKKVKKCPSCGRQIYLYAQVCPYCKAETHFASIDEVEPPVYAEPEEPENPGDVAPAPESPEVEEPQDFSSEEKEGHLGKYIKHLREDTEKVKHEYEEKIGKKYSPSTILIGSVIALLSVIVLCFFIAVKMMQTETFSLNNNVDNELKEVIDSVENELYQSSTIVAKFPDRQRHGMIYLQNGHLHHFDAVSQTHEELDLVALNPKAVVDYGGSGVLNAYLSTNEKYILIIASRNSGNTEFGFYRLGTDDRKLEVIDKGRVVPEKDGYTVSTDMRTATYDSNGDKVKGISGAEWENLPKVEKPKKTVERTEEKVEREPQPVSVTEQMKPTVDLAPKPAVPAVPEKITIKPVDTSKP